MMRHYDLGQGLKGMLVAALVVISSTLTAAPAVLKQSEAVVRKKQIENPSYKLNVELPEADQPFQGQVKIKFTFHPQNQPLRIDFHKGQVEKLLINGRTAPYQFNGTAIELAESQLLTDAPNEVDIVYSHPYSKDGYGLYWMRDAVDNRAYTYTKFEPYHANEFFPCFDQPDLKATFQLTVKVPADWTVVSAVRESTIRDAGSQRIWEFPESPRFSTYLLSLIAGPYKVWEDTRFRIPLRLMARQSLAEHVPVDEWFRVTRLGLDYFERFLGVPYPFVKFDQIVVPDFVSGAMENVAAVTFSERFIVRGKRTLANDQWLANIILHEMAHMWFGNLVTMAWFGDLWLNESFASYASYLAMGTDPRFPGTWLDFYGFKAGGYMEDQLVTTHPIVVDVPDTDAASANFDRITYNKGASFLKQLHFKLGDASFQKGLKIYFQKHAYGNTQVRDFTSAMEEATGLNLKNFSDEWLTKAGLNTLKAEFTCSKGRITDFHLTQGGALPDLPTLREHSTKVALYSLTKGRFSLIKEESITYRGAKTVWPAARGLTCPDLVLPNKDDHDFVKVLLDPKSLKTALQSLSQIEDPLQRVMIWTAVSDLVNEGKVSLEDLAQMIVKFFPDEHNTDVLDVVSDLVMFDVIGYGRWMGQGEARNKTVSVVARAYQKKLVSPQSTAEMKKLLWRNYLTLLTLQEDTAEILKIWEGKEKSLDGLLFQDDRWSILLALSKLGHKPVLAWSAEELKKDVSHQGQHSFLAIQAAYPDYGQKMKLLQEALHGPDKPAAQRRAIINNLFPETQQRFRNQYASSFVRDLDKVISHSDSVVANNYTTSLVPYACGPESVSLLDEIIKRNYRKDIQNRLLVSRQLNLRCARIMARLKGGKVGPASAAKP